eukprot:5798524-Prymnesium_polylepis.1
MRVRLQSGALVCKEPDKCKAGTRQKHPNFSECFRMRRVTYARVPMSRGPVFRGALTSRVLCPFATRTETLHRGTILRGVLVGGESRVLFSRCFGD